MAIKYEINGHIVEADAELSEAEIDEIAASLGPDESSPQTVPNKTGSNPVVESLKKLGTGILGPTDKFATPMGSPADLFSATGPSRLSASITDLARRGGEVQAKGLQMAGIPAPLAKTSGFLKGMALDPQNYAVGGVGKAGAVATEGAMNLAGKKVLAPMGEVLSATRVKDIARLFNKPKEILLAPSLKTSGKAMGDVEKALEVTPDELRLIAKAGDRAAGGSRTVVEQLIAKGKELATEAKDQAENWAKYLTPGELIAGRRAASKLTSAAKGREVYQATQDLKAFEDQFVVKAKDKALTYLSALKDQANARTRGAFLNALPLNKNMSQNALRGVGMLAVGTVNPWLAVAGMPLTTGIATLAAKGISAAAQPVLRSPLIHKAGGVGALALLRQATRK